MYPEQSLLQIFPVLLFELKALPLLNQILIPSSCFPDSLIPFLLMEISSPLPLKEN